MPEEPLSDSPSIPWDKLLHSIHKGHILPVLGPGLSLIEDEGETITLHQWLAPRLAEKLNVRTPNENPSLNQVVSHALMARHNRAAICCEISILIDDLIKDPSLKLPQPLIDLASIRDFDLFITSAFDPLLSLALEQQRPGYSAKDGSTEFRPSKQSDIPDPLPDTFVYQILGSFENQDYAVWEEDYMEYICGLLQSQRDNQRHLFDTFQERSLLLIGAPFTDWIVRFFLRAAKGHRLSNQSGTSNDYFADEPEFLTEPMVFFFDQVIQSPRIIPSDLSSFTAELARRWREEYQQGSTEDFLNSIPDDMEQGSVFISYSRFDLEHALTFAIGLRQAGIPVWLDKKRLKPGGDWENHLLRAVKSRASLFLSLVSQSTEEDPEGNPDRFLHTERNWAAEKHIPGNIFYLPVVIDDTPLPPKQGPPVFSTVQCISLPNGEITSDFARLIQGYLVQYRQKGEITDA